MCVKVHQFSVYSLFLFSHSLALPLLRTHTHTHYLVRFATYSASLVRIQSLTLCILLFSHSRAFISTFWQESMRQKWECVHFNRLSLCASIYTYFPSRANFRTTTKRTKERIGTKCRTIETERKSYLYRFSSFLSLSLSLAIVKSPCVYVIEKKRIRSEGVSNSRYPRNVKYFVV